MYASCLRSAGVQCGMLGRLYAANVGKSLGCCETVTSILIRIQVMSKEERIYVHEKYSYSAHTEH